MSSSVLVVSPEPVGERIAGPAIRALELARVLAAECRVTLAAPAPSSVEDEPFELVEVGLADFRVLLAHARAHDVVVAHELPPTLLGRLPSLPCRLVADLYNPVVFEVLEAGAGEPGRERRRSAELVRHRTLALFAAADLVTCATERQRDLWLGGMALAGLVDPDAYARDPALKSRIQVVPFGMPSEPPPPPEPGLLPEGRVLVWGSGLWNWLDPLTPMRALEHLPGDVRLVFMGTRRPGLVTSPQDAYADLVREQAERMGLLGERVHFNEGWVPYAERGRWLTGAALGVSAQPDHLEARFAHRTRLLDYLWAGLPVVTTGGDVLSEMIGSRGLGRAVPPADPERFAAACSELLEDDGERQAARDRIAEVAPSLRWEEVARPLVEWCAEPPPPRPRRRAFLARANARQYRHALADSMARDGPRTAIARVLRRIGRSLPSRG